ncbi:hypothetical protein [Streptomyces sp. NBC_00083]|uniref:hypothetical protein n=1 Tax=Streptomyces sp. NBC_00083 TaxID=2975647 RepID=UPI00224EBB3C|nr:hypothetical protein [Streptomyces sp. NBC_00083]MCX5386714.1 hypothetical protein [Streptomyces sp. NBC_00083]
MSTTRHLVNRQRRLAHAGAARATEPAPDRVVPSGRPAATERPAGTERPAEAPPGIAGKKPPRGSRRERIGKSRDGEASSQAPEEVTPPGGPAVLRIPGALAAAAVRRVGSVPAPVVLCVLVVLLGAFAGLAATRADTLRSDPAARNAALTDPARTSEVKGQTARAVASLFSYNYADTGAADKAASTLLTGKAVQQHHDMLAAVRAQGKDQKLVLTTTVTESGVEMIDGSRARVLVYADQSSTRTAGKKPETTYAAAMFAVDVVRGSGATWKVSGIDTFGQGS